MSTAARPSKATDSWVRGQRQSALLDLAQSELTMVGEDLPRDFLVWVEAGPPVHNTARGIRPTKEWVETALTERLERELGCHGQFRVKIVEAMR